MKRSVYLQFKYRKAVIGFYSSVTYGATFPAREGLDTVLFSPTDGAATVDRTITTNLPEGGLLFAFPGRGGYL